MGTVLVSTVGLLTGIAHADGDLFISEYIEGSGYNKAIELANTTGATIDLSGYQLEYYLNGNSSPGITVSLSGSVADGDVFVVAHSSANSAIRNQADLLSSGGWFNGNDAVVLRGNGVIVDIIGQIGFNPGSEWGSALASTQNNTLRRQSSVCAGDANGNDSFDPSAEWTGFAQNDSSDLGSHSSDCGGGGADELFISEYIEGSSYNKAIELANLTGAAVDLSSYRLQYYFNGNSSPGRTIVLSGTVADGDVFVVAHGSATSAIRNQADLLSSGAWFNGDDAVALSKDGALIDVIGQIGSDPGTEWGSGLASTQNNTLRRHSAVCAGDANGGDGFDPADEWDGFAQNNSGDLGAHSADCGGGDETRIHTVQGSGTTSPLLGQQVTIEAIVVGDFQGSSSLNGFFVQEEDSDVDSSTTTSEGIFIYDGGSGPAVSVGDRVSVTGTVEEYFEETQLGGVSVSVVSSGNPLPTAADIILPVSAVSDLERYEGMRVHMPQTLTVTENYNLGRYGEVWLSSGGRLMQPTNVADPGAPALAVQATNDRNRILLDDRSFQQNPDPIPHPTPELSASNTLRSGYTTTGVIGVLGYDFGTYRIQPTEDPTFVAFSNLRPSTPGSVGSGSLRVASFNVLNYFNGNGMGGGFPTSRGADTAAEFARQHTKIVAAILAMDADIIGLMEIENDGYGSNSAIQDLVDGLNAAAPSGTSYALIDPGVGQIGSDAIAVGLIYRVQTVRPVGGAAILDASVDSRFNDDKNRPVLVQSFGQMATGGVLTVAVNHLKSKGSSCDSLGDPDTG
ncbi:MAG: ExeM/NucH family extracellular endonuclease, partial [Myxococcota bacterium]